MTRPGYLSKYFSLQFIILIIIKLIQEMEVKMFKTILTAILVAGFLISCQPDRSGDNMNKINKIISSVKQQWAPDKRIAIFNIDSDETAGIITLTGETNLPEAHNDLIEQLKNNKINVIDNINVLPDKSLGEEHFGIIRLSVANIRTKPAHSAELATQALLGTVVKIYKKSSYWYLVQTPDDYLAWVDASGITLVTAKTADQWKKNPKILYLTDNGFAYSAPLRNSERVSDLVAGDLLELLEESFDFYHVRFPDGRTAYVPSSEADIFADWLTGEPDVNNIIRDARKYIGLPYLWGGTSTKNFDCSGFTKTVFYLNGVVLARDASQQVYTGHPIDTDDGFDNLVPGDLLFFGRAATDSTKERVTHVGLYMGDTEFIHASGLVKINSIDSTRSNFNKYRYDTFIRARRIMTSLNENGIRLVKDHPAYVLK